MAQVSYGTITITDTNDINRIYVEYCRSTSNQLSGTTVPNITRAWGETTPEWIDGEYIWQRAVIEKSGTLEKTYGKPVCLTGAQGETGDQGPQGPQGGTGAAGRSLTSTTTQYTTAAANATITQNNMSSYTWSSNVPTYNANTPAYWVRITNVYSNPSSTEYIIYKDNGITDAVKTSNDANTTAGNAWDKADNAEDIAQQASDDVETLTTTYNTFINTQAKYFVRNSTGSIVIGSRENESTPVAFDVTNVSTYGYNSLMAPSQISLRYNDKILSSWSAAALTFYKPSTTSQGAKAMELTGSALKFYNPTNDSISMMDLTSSGLTFKTAAGATIGTFGSDSSGGLLDLSGRLNIKGGGRIGQDSTNYWEFGDNAGYNVSKAAYLLGKGNTSIQLGENGHWRIDKNRIHTGWYVIGDSSSSTPAGSLHFDTYNVDRTSTSSGDQFYWDYGMHFPFSNTTPPNNKFLYIRYSNTTVATTTLSQMKGRIDNDNYWYYKFYVDDLGNVHSPSYYIINDDGSEQTLSGSGLVASSLSCGTVGSLTQPIYFNNGVPATTTYALNAAGAKGVDTSIAAASTSTNLPTSNAVAAFVEGKGYITSYTDNKVLTELASNNTTFYIAGPINTATTTGTLKVITDAKITVNSSGKATITATTFSGSLSGTASRATADSDGNTIKTTYLKLSGGNVTGAVSFGSSVSADELTVGDLVVNGAASFTNNLQADTINGVSVGLSPKFTDTVTTVTVTGNGNAITAASASNGVVTLTKGTTFLTSYTETDPIFVASAAHGITSTDISNWNSKTSNTGTVTSVRVQASSPLTSTTSTASSTTLDTTIKFANQNKNLVLAGPSSGNAAAPTFRSLVAADIPNLSWNKITSDKPTTLSGYGITDAAGSNAIVGLSASSNSAGVTTFTATRASGTNPLSFEVSIVASAATGANALKDSNGLISKGSTTKPVYFNNGVPAEANTYAGGTAVTLNGSDKGTLTASFYAPITAGTTSQVLIGGGSAPTWTDISNLVPTSATNATNDSDGNPINTTYVKKAGSQMSDSGYISRKGKSMSWQKGRDGALIKTITANSYSPFASIKTTNGSWDIGTYNANGYYDDLLFSYVTDTLYNSTTTQFTKQIKFLENGHIVADGFDGKATSADTADSATTATTATTSTWTTLIKPIADTTTASTSTWSIPSGSKQVWGERFSDSTLEYTPSGGSATTITDTGDLVLFLTPNATSNLATLNMKIDGTYYGSFSGGLSGNASTATKLATARTIQTNLASTSSASFDGSGNITPGITGTLGTSNGGTGNTSFTQYRLTYAETATKQSSIPNISYYTGTSTASTPATYNRLHIHGSTYGNTAETMISGTAGLFSFGDGGPQITFDTSATPGGSQAGALIFTDNDTAAAGASWHFVSNQTDWNVTSKRFHARMGISIGTNLPNTSCNLYVSGTSILNGSTTVNGNILKVVNNSNTVEIGAKNNSFIHIYSNSTIPFIFNNSILTTSGDLGNNSYPFTNANIKGAYNMLVGSTQKAAMHYDSALEAIVFSFA